MKTTLDIPEVLYRKAKIRAVEEGSTLKAILLRGLKFELSSPTPVDSVAKKTFLERRRLRPGFKRLIKRGALSGGTDSTQIIAQDRTKRHDSLAQ